MNCESGIYPVGISPITVMEYSRDMCIYFEVSVAMIILSDGQMGRDETGRKNKKKKSQKIVMCAKFLL